MFDFESLRDQLQRKDVLTQWKKGFSYPVGNKISVEFAASIAIREKQHARPSGVEFFSADVELGMKYESVCDLQNVTDCDAQVTIEGIDGQGGIHRFALHFDRHNLKQKSTDLHALYHWQIGGRKIVGANFGNLIFFGGPRFPYHPLDPVLLVDFVLGHFHGTRRDALLAAGTSGSAYADLLRSSQDRLVKPFFARIHAALQGGDTGPALELWPSLCFEAESAMTTTESAG